MVKVKALIPLLVSCVLFCWSLAFASSAENDLRYLMAHADRVSNQWVDTFSDAWGVLDYRDGTPSKFLGLHGPSFLDSRFCSILTDGSLENGEIDGLSLSTNNELYFLIKTSSTQLPNGMHTEDFGSNGKFFYLHIKLADEQRPQVRELWAQFVNIQ